MSTPGKRDVFVTRDNHLTSFAVTFTVIEYLESPSLGFDNMEWFNAGDFSHRTVEETNSRSWREVSDFHCVRHFHIPSVNHQ